MHSSFVPPATATAAASPFEVEEMTLIGREQRLRVAWADGHVSDLHYAYLRGFCPCAVCQGHGNGLSYVPYGGPAPALSLLDVLEVGHYAVNLVWNDGHRTGIYAWSYLRGLCPCTRCVKQVGQSHALHRLPASAFAACGMAPERASSPD